MKALIVGCGKVGSAAAEDLAKNNVSLEVVIADRDAARAEAVANKIKRKNLSWAQLDVTNHKQTLKILKDFDVILGFLPGNLGYHLIEACIETRKHLVDVSFMAENPLTLNDNAAKADVTIVPDCGLAPGISNILIGHAKAELDKVNNVNIMVGGLPEKPEPPLGYVVTWSPESLIDEYMRKARIVKAGKVVEVEALSGLEEVAFPNVGVLEAFYTDGLRTLLYTMHDVADMCEKTLRYPGHAEKVKLLKSLGFFDEEPVKIGDVEISPKRLTARLLERKLVKPEIKDFVALKVEVAGTRNGKQTRYVYHMLDWFDDKLGVTAMARTTAYPAAIVAGLILDGDITEKGVVPPEKIGMDEEVFQKFLSGLKQRGITIAKEIITS